MTQILKNYFLVFKILLIFNVLPAQHPSVWNIDDEDGLPSLTVYDIMEDARGYLWLGMENGLFRYNGIDYKLFLNEEQKGRSMTDIFEDYKGRIWATNFYGQLFYVEQDSLHRVSILDNLPQQKTISAYIVDRNDQLYLFNNKNGSIYQINLKSNAIKEIQLNEKLEKQAYIRDVVMMDDASIWVTENSSGLWKIHPQIQLFGKPEAAALDRQFKLLAIDNQLIVADYTSDKGKTIFTFSESDGFRQLALSVQSKVNDVFSDKSNNIWIATNSGSYVLNQKLEALDIPQPVLQNKAISSVTQDREGAYWVGSLRSGLYFMPSLETLFYNQENADLPDNRINCLSSKQDGTLFLGTSNGKIAQLKDRVITKVYESTVSSSISDIVWSEEDQRLYASQANVLVFEEEKTQAVRSFLYGSVKDLDFTQQGHLVCATSAYPMIESLGRQDDMLGQKRHTLLDDYQGRRIHLRNERSRYVWTDRFEDQIWIAYVDQLYRYTAESDIIISSENPITALCITQTDDGIIWVGTINQGVLAIKNDRVIFRLTDKEGLKSNLCRAIATDGQKIWIGTDKGLHLYDPENQLLEFFNQYDGLRANEITDIHLIKDQLWIASLKGVHEMKQIPNYASVPPPIYITAFAIAEENVDLKTEYELVHHENNLKIEFEGISFRSFDALRYKYRLLGLDTSWVSTNLKTNIARYPFLQPGDYTFQVKAINANGIESKQAASLIISIATPFWRTWWFFSLVALSIVGITASIFSRILYDISRRNKIENALRSSKLSALRAQMNPHFLFNAMNSIQDFILLNDKRQANSYLGKFAGLMRSILEMSGQNRVSLEEEIDALKLYLDLEKLRFEDSLKYEIKVDNNVPVEQAELPPMLIQPHIENAMKHGLLHSKKNRRLFLHFRMQDQKTLQCIIEDNGIGRAAASKLKGKHLGFATKAIEERLRLINQSQNEQIALNIVDLKEENGQARGTRVVLNIQMEMR